MRGYGSQPQHGLSNMNSALQAFPVVAPLALAVATPTRTLLVEALLF